MFGRRHKPKPVKDHDDDLLTFNRVTVEEETDDSVYVTGLPMRQDAKYANGCWLPKLHVIINHRTIIEDGQARIGAYIIMPRWRVFHAAILQEAADSVHRIEKGP